MSASWSDDGTPKPNGTAIPNVTLFTTGWDNPTFYTSLIGKGRKDTYLIVEHLGTTETGRAAQLAVAAGNGGKDDWFLPSYGEAIGMVPTGSWYWTSSQYNNSSAWITQGVVYERSRAKSDTANVRAIRAF